jgi:hypothetical protein
MGQEMRIDREVAELHEATALSTLSLGLLTMVLARAGQPVPQADTLIRLEAGTAALGEELFEQLSAATADQRTEPLTASGLVAQVESLGLTIEVHEAHDEEHTRIIGSHIVCVRGSDGAPGCCVLMPTTRL